MRRFVVAAVAALYAGPASAEVPYLDDRSDPTALLKSLYNAISRSEYARAWSYFAEKPAGTLQDYAEGFADTKAVSVEVGLPSEHEAPDGARHYYVPMAIEATNKDGEDYIYGGCYELKLAAPSLQNENFAPLQIVSGNLSSSSGSLADAVPATCDDLGVPDPGLLIEQNAKTFFRNSFGEICNPTLQEADDGQSFRSWSVRFKYSTSPADDPGAERRVFQFLCSRGAYNETHIFMMAGSAGDLRPLSFAVPDLDIRYRDKESEKVEGIEVKGFHSQIEVLNGDFDPDELTITSYAKWRGVGDAWSAATWLLRDGEFTLTRYDVDASYDGEHDAQTVVRYGSAP